MSEILKIVIVEDIELFRKGLAMVINRFDSMRVIAEFGTGQEFISFLKTQQPDVVLVDIELPDTTGIKLTQAAIKMYPHIKMIALTMFGEDDYINSMIKAGAKGFLLKNIGKTELKKAILTVAGGGTFYSQELMSYFYRKMTKPTRKFNDDDPLSNRELEILKYIAQGMSDAEIANELNLSHRTINGHRQNMFGKTGVKNTVNLIIYAIKNNLIKL